MPAFSSRRDLGHQPVKREGERNGTIAGEFQFQSPQNAGTVTHTTHSPRLIYREHQLLTKEVPCQALLTLDGITGAVGLLLC